MDTLWAMRLHAEFADALDRVRSSLSFDVDGEVSVFETSIRLLGGLLAQGGPRTEGEAYAMFRAALQDRFGVLREERDVDLGKPTQVGDALRPELANAAFDHRLPDRSPRGDDRGA